MTVEIRQMQKTDWADIKRIYIEGIQTGIATFTTIESIPESYEEWQVSHSTVGSFVAVENGEVIGWSSFSRVSSRAVYSGVVEISLYIAANQRGKGIGSKLIQAAIRESEENDIWTIQASIFSENEASIKLHKRAGFRIVGKREKIGKLNNHWKDTLLLERRSNKF